MRYCFSFCACVLSLLALPLVGCGDGSGGTAGTGATGGTGGTAATGGTGGSATVSLSVTVSEAQDFVPFGGPPLEGVELCQTDTTNCATTDAAGLASIMLPANEEVSYTLEKAGYSPFLVADVTDDTFRDTFWPMFSDALTEAAFAAVEIFPPFTGGTVLLRARTSVGPADGIAGVVYDLIDETATPFYQEAGDWTSTFDLAATTATGQGGFTELPDGDYQAEFGGTATNCTPVLGWPGDATNRLRVPIRAGHLTYSTMQCETAP